MILVARDYLNMISVLFELFEHESGATSCVQLNATFAPAVTKLLSSS